MGRAIRIVLLVVLLAILGMVVWLRATPEGRDLADDLSDQWQQWRHGDEEQDAAKKLMALGARMGPSAPPGRHFASINCEDKALGDEGYRLLGKCFRLQAASFIRCDLNNDRMQHLAGLGHLSSLTILDTPAITDAGIKNVASMRELASLLLKGTEVGDLGLESIAQLPELKVLDLSRTRVTDAGIPALANLHTLNWLLLADTSVTDKGVVKLEGLEELKQITLSGTKVSKHGKARLKEMHPGLTID